MKREPQKPSFENRKVPCRIDYRTGRIEWNRGSKITKLWMHISTLKKNQPIVFDAVDEGLKVQMNWMENPASAQGGCLSIH
ncbi:MAG: hypothetical protein ACXQTW_04430 [Candidatus Methanospirareceae archaeon]